MARVRGALGVAVKLAVLVALIYGGTLASEWLTARFVPHLTPSTEPAMHRLIMVAIAIYVLCMMLPFVPGMEIGLGMLIVFGAPIVPLVYGATVLALSLAFLIGRLVPQATITAALRSVGLGRGAAMLEELDGLAPADRLGWLLARAPGRVLPQLVRFRYLALLVLFNLPGNAVIGGGGGIAMLSGFSRLFSTGGFVAAVAVAVSPVPLLILLTGMVPASLAGGR
jgi:hypothetical protein